MAASAADRPPTGNRKTFRRTKVSVGERTASVAIVVLLGAIGVAIFIKGRHYDPGRFMLRTSALQSTVAEVKGKAGTAAGADVESGGSRPSGARPTAGEDEGEPAEGHAGAAPAGKGEPLDLKLDGLKPMADTEFYNADNLFEKIDGRAPAYLTFNFQQLRCRSFTVAGAPGSFVDVYEYRFDTPVNAFGMFALERDPKGSPLAFAPDGYASGMGFFFRQGNCYVQVLASDPNDKTLELAKAIAENRANHLPADDTGLAARRRLPAAGLDPASVQFVQENAQGQSFLKNVFQASYDFAGQKVPFFLMVTSPADAADAWKAYLAFAGQFGGQVTPLPDMSGAKVFAAQNFGTWKVIYQRAGELGGVYDVADLETARQFTEKYLAGEMK
ncbi:MAG TPA: DUF6599 family protein [Candidatus Acidoferrum sp.]|nr:DUF6599 family protein [Candidatus Acidoferrum sp.]